MNQVMEQQLIHSSRRRMVNGRLRTRRNLSRQKEIQIQGEKTEEVFHFAGFWMRFWAYLLDMIILFSLNGLLIYPLIRLTDWNDLHLGGFFRLDATLTALVFFLYFAIMTKYFRQTIGKMVMGLQVVSVANNQLSWTQIVFREGVGRFLHQAFFFLYAIYVMVAFTGTKQGLHDKIADTYVVFERNHAE